MTEDKTYHIAGHTLVLGPLTIGQFKTLLSLMEDLEVTQDTCFEDLLNVLISEKLPRLMAIIFPNQGAETIDWQKVPYDQVDEVLEDFFVLNPRLMNRLKSLLVGLSSMAGKATQSSETTG